MSSADAAADAWSRLWRHGTLHSCATGISGNYDGAIAAFWQRQFGGLPAGARVVDIGTGNGALLLLADDVARRRGTVLDLHGIDVARIDPARDVPGGAQRFAGIRFHPETPAQQLPFADGSVDLVCSQFGFEYAPRDAAVREAGRVLSQAGRLALLVHSHDSVVARTSGPQRRGCAFLLRDCDVLQRAADLVPLLHRAAVDPASVRGDAAAEAARNAFNRAAQSLVDAVGREPQAEVLARVAQQLQGALREAARSPEQAHARLVALRDALRDEDERLAQLQAALLDPDALQALVDAFRAQGVHCTTASIEQQPGLRMGWTLEGWRA